MHPAEEYRWPVSSLFIRHFMDYAGVHGPRKHGPARRMAAGNDLAKAQVS